MIDKLQLVVHIDEALSVFLIMQECGIVEVLAHDDHFQPAGFTSLRRAR
jgi:predicted nucleic acid-binding protein